MEPMFDLEIFARRLRVAIATLNIEQAEAARQAGVTPSAVSRICAEITRPNIENYARLNAWLERVESK